VRTDEKHQQDVQRCIDAFQIETKWTPSRIKPVAGALLYTQYSWMKRTLMRLISEKEGGDVDTTKDYVYTDWADLRATVEAFALPVPV
jgi:menaquinone-dependent protoporphyrinogen oxidase